MALTATIFKAELQVADMDRSYYGNHSLTVARHPSETDERMLVRLLAFALHASGRLAFTKGLCADDEPDLWQKSLTEEVEIWIDVGLPEEKRLRKACRRAGEVYVYAYGGRGAASWWQRMAPVTGEYGNLHVINLPYEATQAMAQLAERNMNLQCTVQEGQIWFGTAERSLFIEPEVWK